MSELVQLQIASRPKLVKCGLSEHGLQGREEYELPTLWCLHLYFYEVQIAVGGRTHFIRPGSLTVIPPGTRIVYHYTARRHRHFFVHFALRAGPPAAVSLPLCQHVPGALDFEKLQRACQLFTGTHDFGAFSLRRSNGPEQTVRTIHCIENHIAEEKIDLTFEGEGFLYKMVRILSAAIIRHASGKVEIEELAEHLRSATPVFMHTAPAAGLCLVRVIY
jgi:tRNA pseudouridine(38-40) synthase